jgi:L,D-peptidoglycan transpeptidase YkuD (ErfK/YbiS/YcfS/YnhG family)
MHTALNRKRLAIYITILLGYNDSPSVAGKGRAIFMHIVRANYSPTEGCIALLKDDLLEILKTTDKNTQVCVKN